MDTLGDMPWCTRKERLTNGPIEWALRINVPEISCIMADKEEEGQEQ